jgi:hypothetical protein
MDVCSDSDIQAIRQHAIVYMNLSSEQVEAFASGRFPVEISVETPAFLSENYRGI